MFKLASLLLDFGLAVHREAVGEQALCQTMSANDAACFFTSPGRELHHQRSVAD